MNESQLGRGRVREYDTPAYPGFISDGESNFQLPFYYQDGRFLAAPYIDGEPSFTVSREVVIGNTVRSLKEPRRGDELVYRLVGQGAIARVVRWTYAAHYDAMRLHAEKPSE